MRIQISESSELSDHTYLPISATKAPISVSKGSKLIAALDISFYTNRYQMGKCSFLRNDGSNRHLLLVHSK